MMRTSVLVVDDDESERILLESILRGAGYEVASVDRGEAALQRMRATPPDLVVLDLLMPGLDGWGVLRAMRGSPQLARISVVILTAYGSQDEVPTEWPVIHKPVDADLLRDLVATLIAQARSIAVQRQPGELLPQVPRGLR